MILKKHLHKLATISFAVILITIILLQSFNVSFAAKGVLKRPSIKGKSGIVYCENSGDILYSKNMNQRMDPYSITKIVTAFLAVQNLDLNKVITIDKETAKVGEATLYLAEGEKLTVRDLLYGTLFRSANDAAYALGIAVAGDMDSFVEKMNQLVENMGLENTHFTNAHGLKEKKHYTTAFDMMEIARIAFDDKTIQEITSAYEYTIPKTNKSDERKIYNQTHNFKYEGVNNCKTGTWDENNSTMVVRFNQDGLTLYSVIMGEPFKSRFSDMSSIIDYSRSKISSVLVEPKGKILGQADVKRGAESKVTGYLKTNAECFIPKEASKSLVSKKVVFNKLKAPIKQDDVIGSLEIYLADELINVVDIRAKQSVEKGWVTSYLGLSNNVAIVIITITLAILLFIIVILIIRANNIKKKKAKRQAKIRQLAMEREEKEREKKERDWNF